MPTVAEALDAIYAALHDNNKDIDIHIDALKAALPPGQKTVEVETSRLAQGNRQGRKVMQAYFRKRGLALTFSAPATEAAG